ncbi:unnamed protein product [Dibothriocephalus latus]|uniref:SCP domain-containing protein n=1 Tax=Dibothriocephalus latus TaxID=60516 RepID=A0A3P6QJY2_DIBLA|nr:unnamed protein product [Dibothriocephalus latus]
MRELHGVPPLQYSKRLAANAQSYAEYLAKYDLFDHSECKNYGENLIVRTGPPDLPLTGVEVSLQEGVPLGARMILKSARMTYVAPSTEKVGFGVARSKDKKSVYIVAHYFPPGNYEKDYKKNVLPPEGGRLFKPTNKDLGKFTEVYLLSNATL